MPRAARVVAVGVPHHITQRGNNRQDIFVVDEDRQQYLKALAENSARYGIRLLGWCLMTNHAHLVAVPERSDAFARGLQRCHSRWAQQFNRRYARSGHLWQGRFFSCALGRDHLATALAYVDLNPVRAGLVGDALAYPWSSAEAHAEGRDRRGLLDLALWRQVPGHERWADVFEHPFAEERCQAVRSATRSGLPLGNESFVCGLERQLGRGLRAGKPGRKPKAAGAVRA